jgi:hypothetical protein
VERSKPGTRRLKSEHAEKNSKTLLSELFAQTYSILWLLFLYRIGGTSDRTRHSNLLFLCSAKQRLSFRIVRLRFGGLNRILCQLPAISSFPF